MLSANVLMNHVDPANDGQNLNETLLTPANVASASFGKLFTVPLDGAEVGQPLFRSGVDITTGSHKGTQDVAFVATAKDSLYAIGAASGVVLWKSTLLHSFHGGTPTANSGNGVPIQDTPAIDPSANVLYVESEEQESGHYIDLLSSINLSNGTRYANPVNIAESNGSTFISGPRVNRIGGGKTVFDVQDTTCRCLTLDTVDHVVYMGWADPGDGGPYNGWIVGYSAAKNSAGNLTLKAQWCATPQGSGTSQGAGGIWEGGGAIAFDSSGDLYLITGNGGFETTEVTPAYVADGRLASQTDNHTIPGGLKVPKLGDYGDAVIKLSPDGDTSQHSDNPNGFGLHVADFFTPKDEQPINVSDRDLGSSSPVLLPASVGSSAHRNLLLINDKQGILYLIDRNNMGGYHGDAAGDGKSGSDNVVQIVSNATTGAWSTAAFYAGANTTSGTIYYVTQGDAAKAFSISNATINPTPTSTSASSYGTYGYPGSTPEISANVNKNAILWTLDKSSADLVAYNALNLNEALFQSNALSQNKVTGSVQTFCNPTEANGHVFVGTSDALNIYGLKSTVQKLSRRRARGW